MLILELIQNVALLVALAVTYRILVTRYERSPSALRKISFRILTGLMFGLAGIVGMMTPLDFSPGIIFDARSVILSVAGLFGGPIPALVAAIPCAVYRLMLGGDGAGVGVAVIIEAAALGSLLHVLRRRYQWELRASHYFAFGLAVHVLMLVIMLWLPGDTGWEVIRRIGPSVILLYPLATMLVCRLFDDYAQKARQGSELRGSEERFRSFLRHSPILISECSLDGRYLRVNEALANVFGMKPGEVEGKSFNDLLPESAASLFRERIAKVAESRTALSADDHIDAPHGPAHYLTTLFPLFDAEGTVSSVGAVAHDISERIRSEEALRASEELYRTTLASIGDAVISTDADGNVKTMNPVAEHLTGWQGKDATGRPLTEVFRIVNANTREMVENPVEKVFARGKIVGLANHTLLIARDGTERQIADSAAPIRGCGEEILGVVLVFRDVTEEYAAAERLRSSEADLRQAQRVAQVGSWRFDLNTKTVTASEEARRIYGIGDRDLTIPEAQAIPLEEYRQSLDNALRALVGKGEDYDLEFRIRRISDGAIRDIHSVAEYDPESNVVIGTIQDITERKEADSAKARQQALLEAIYRNAPLIMMVVDAERRVRQINGFATQFAGRPAEEMLGLRGGEALRCLHALDDPEGCGFGPYCRECTVRNTVLDTLEQGKTHLQVEAELPFRIDGRDKELAFLLSTTPLSCEGDRLALVTILNITDRKEAETALRESEHRFRSFIENANDIVYAVSPEGLFTYISPNWMDFMGEPAEDAVGKSFEPYVHPDDVHLCRDFLDAVLRTGEKQDSVEYRVRHRDGSWRWHVSNGSPMRDMSGNVTGYVGIARDVTEAKKVEDALRESEHRIQSIFRSAPVGIGVVIDRVLKGGNPKLCEITGYTEEELAEQSARMLYPTDEDFNFVGQEKYRQIRERGTGTVETQWKRKDGSIIDVLLSSTPIDMNDLGKGVTFTALDITEQKQMSERMRQMEKMDAIGQLAGGVAHDFNNQLGGIMGYADMLTTRLEDPGLRRYADNILACTRRAGDLTAKLLAFARKGQYQSVSVDMHDIIHDVVDFLRHSIDKKIEIKQILTASPCLTKGDPTQLQNALLNLAINAADAMQDGGELVFETANAELDEEYCSSVPYGIEPGQYLHICISDTGCGIPKENLDRIFEPFFTTKEVGKGTGMGLAAVYGTVKQHGGAINVYSEIGQGTTFRLYLPIEADGEVVEKRTDETVRATREAAILVVDDEQVIRDMTEDMLADLGYTVTVKDNGESALAYFREHWREIDLVILDMVMPRMNGPEAFRMMKEIDPEVKVLLASGYSAGGAARDLLAEGVRGFIQKPFTRAELSAKVAAALDDSVQP